MTQEHVDPAPYIEGDRLCVLRKLPQGQYEYVPATVVASTYQPRAPFGKHWVLTLAIDGQDIPGRVSVDFNGTGYDVPGRPSTQPLVEED